MKKVQFNLNGKAVSVGGPGPRAQKVLDFIRSIPNGKYFDAEGVARCIQSTKGAVDQSSNKYQDELSGYFIVIPNPNGIGRKKVFGSKPSIAKLAKDLQEQDVI